jgi:hypothetical protein
MFTLMFTFSNGALSRTLVCGATENAPSALRFRRCIGG